MSSHSHSYRTSPDQSGAFAKMAAVLLGLLVAVVGFFALLMWLDARDSGTAEAAPPRPSRTTTPRITTPRSRSTASPGRRARTRRSSRRRTSPMTRRCRRFRRATS